MRRIAKGARLTTIPKFFGKVAPSQNDRI